MSHSHHDHTEGLHCACCNPIWKEMYVDMDIDNKIDIQLELEIEQLTSKELIIRTIDPNDATKSPGYIQTLEQGENKLVEAMGVKNGYVVATGTFEEVQEKMSACNNYKYVLEGHTLIPGLIEPHIHIIPTAAFNLMYDVGPFLGQELRSSLAKTLAETYTKNWVLETLKTLIMISGTESEKAKTWILGRNVDPSLFQGEDKLFNLEALNSISTEQPVFIMNSSMHLAYVNQKAIDLGKENNIELSTDGILEELEGIAPAFELIAKFYSKEFLLKSLNEKVDDIFKEASKRGVTYVFDAGVEPVKGQVDYLKLKSELNCPVRIGGALVADSLENFNTKIEGKYTLKKGNEKFNLAFIKVLSDGSNQGLTGYQKTPYDCDDNYNRYDKLPADKLPEQTNTGIFNYGYPVEFDTIIQKAVDRNWPIMVHANGDHAIDRTVNAFKIAGISNETVNERRDRIEHASLLSDTNLQDMENLGVSPSFLIGHVGYWGWVFQQTILGRQRSNQLDRCGTAIKKHKMKISLHTDYSVTPLGPLRMMEQAITRDMEGAPNHIKPITLNEEEQITRLEALKAVTYDAAWQCHADQWVGSLEPGKCADFTILKESPLTYSNKESGAYSAKGLRDIPVLETWKGGKEILL